MTLQQLLGIELPIIQAPMAGSQASALAVAVCNAGGLGSLPCAMLSLDALRGELSALSKIGDRPRFHETEIQKSGTYKTVVCPRF